MTIKAAVKEMIELEEFKADAKEQSYLRVFLKRYRNGEIKTCASIEMLQKYGYEIDIKRKSANKR